MNYRRHQDQIIDAGPARTVPSTPEDGEFDVPVPVSPKAEGRQQMGQGAAGASPGRSPGQPAPSPHQTPRQPGPSPQRGVVQPLPLEIPSDDDDVQEVEESSESEGEPSPPPRPRSPRPARDRKRPEVYQAGAHWKPKK